MGRLSVARSVEVAATAEAAWHVLADEFLEISHWARGVKSSGANPAATHVPDGASTGGRICELRDGGTTDERIIHFDATEKEITYSAASDAIPGFVAGIQNAWTVRPIGPETARVTTEISADLSGIMGVLMAPMIKRKFAGTLDGLLADLRVYTETGSASPAK